MLTSGYERVTKHKILKVCNIVFFVLVMFIAYHLLACLFLSFGSYEGEGYAASWFDALNINRDDLKSQYLYSFYFIITTMGTIGYGDVVPSTM